MLSAWEDAPDWDFILTDGVGNELSSGWIDESNPAETIAYAESADEATVYFMSWTIDSVSRDVSIEVDIIDDDLGLVEFDHTFTLAELQDALDGAIVDECGQATIIDGSAEAEPATILAIGAMTVTAGKVLACANDTLSQAKDGLATCAAAFPGIGTNYDQCAECVQDKFNGDLLNCTISFGWNGPDNDYGNCVNHAWVQPGGDPMPSQE